MGSHYYEPNINVEKSIESYADNVEYYTDRLHSGKLNTQEYVNCKNNLKVATNCLRYLHECKAEGTEYVSIADMPLHS